MNRPRVASLVTELDLPKISADRKSSLAEFASSSLRAAGISEHDEAAAAVASKNVTVSFARVGLGVGFTSWVVYEATQNLSAVGAEQTVEAIFEQAEKWTGFVLHTIQHPEDWSDVAHLVQHIFENAWTLPSGTIQVIADIIVAVEQGGNIWDGLEAVGAASHVADWLEAAGTLGLSLALSYAAGKIADSIVEGKVQPLREKLNALKMELTELLRLRHALSLGFPAPAITPYLENVPESQWAF